jgi:hypothetical protein
LEIEELSNSSWQQSPWQPGKHSKTKRRTAGEAEYTDKCVKRLSEGGGELVWERLREKAMHVLTL